MGGAYTAVRGEVVMVPRLGGDHTPVASGAQLETEPEPGLGTHCLQTVITNTGDRGWWSSAVCDSLNIISEGPRSLLNPQYFHVCSSLSPRVQCGPVS